LHLGQDKALAKKVIRYHGIRTPSFMVAESGEFELGEKLSFPVIVKPCSGGGSVGIDAGSVVHRRQELLERARLIQDELGCPALVEQYIEGRELYVGILGNQTLQALPVWELFFTNMPEGAKRIATDRVKWSVKYQKKYGIDSGIATDLADGQGERIQHLCKRAYRALELNGYARVDLRLDAAGNAWVIEANPNPQIARGEDFAASAEKIGMSYDTLLQRIINLGLRWQPESVA
jgi:D-alanine-D-alanine ligase